MPICTKCNQDKPLTEFYFRKDRNRHIAWCHSCKYAYDKSHNRSNPNRQPSKTKCDRRRRYTSIKVRLTDQLRSRLTTSNLFKVSAIRDLGCTVEELIKHLESLFYPSATGLPMDWSNRGVGPGTWQIDHIIPISAMTEENALSIVHYTNLRPLWHEDHILKSLEERR